MKIALDVVKSQEKILQTPAPDIVFKDFADSALTLEIRYHIENIDIKTKAATQLRLDINKAFNEHNIGISFPQMDIHI